MTDTQTIMRALRQPFDVNQIHWRVGSTNREKTQGMALAYLDARDVMERLDEAVGPENWQCKYPHAGQKTVCDIGLRINDEWIWKSNGAGDTNHEADKGALSDGFKRAAVLWGVGRYLYDLKSPWVNIEQRGNSYVIARSEYAKLDRVLAEYGAPPSRSANSLKLSDKDGKDAWERITEQLHKEFADTYTTHQLNKLETAYQEIVKQDRWPAEWRRILRAKFDEKARELADAKEPA